MWVSREIRILWKEWQKIRIIQKNIVIEIDEDELQPQIINTSHSQNLKNDTTSSLFANTDSPTTSLERITALEEKLSRIEEAFGWSLDSHEQPITIARINEGSLTYIVVVEAPEDDEENLLPGHQNPRAIRPRFVKRPEKLSEY